MTPDQTYLFNYLYAERLGHLCGDKPATLEQIKVAFDEAERGVEEQEKLTNKSP